MEQPNNENNSKALDLESLNTEYKNLLIEYKQSVSNYVNYLKQELEQPCKDFTPDSKNINQKCYQHIWEKSGCTTTGMVDASNTWSKSQTLNGLIYDSFLWATQTDEQHRSACYGENYQSANLNTSVEPNYNINQQEMSSIKGANYWGTNNLSISSSSTLEECKALCATTKDCSGATFNPDNGMCFLRSGDGELVGGLPNQYAIVPKGKQLLKIIQNINQKLTHVNEKIQDKTPSIEKEYNLQEEQRSDKNKDLINQYINLMMERNKIDKMLNEYQTLDEQQVEGNIHISQNYYSFLLLMILVILFIYILYKFSGQAATTSIIQNGGQLSNNAYYIISGIVIFILLIISFNKYKLL